MRVCCQKLTKRVHTVHILKVKRKDIYQAYVKSLVEQGLAYPCFMTEEELCNNQRKAGK